MLDASCLGGGGTGTGRAPAGGTRWVCAPPPSREPVLPSAPLVGAGQERKGSRAVAGYPGNSRRVCQRARLSPRPQPPAGAGGLAKKARFPRGRGGGSEGLGWGWGPRNPSPPPTLPLPEERPWQERVPSPPPSRGLAISPVRGLREGFMAPSADMCTRILSTSLPCWQTGSVRSPRSGMTLVSAQTSAREREVSATWIRIPVCLHFRI